MAGLHCSLFTKAGVSGVELNPDAPPGWSHNRDWGYAPTGGLGLILAIVGSLVARGDNL